MNYPKMQARKALLKKLINERKDELFFLKAEYNHFVSLDKVVFRPEIEDVSRRLKASKRDLRVLEGMARSNKRELADRILIERFVRSSAPTGCPDLIDDFLLTI